jgi:hypothetical protein
MSALPLVRESKSPTAHAAGLFCALELGLQKCSPHGAKRNAGMLPPRPPGLRFASSKLRWLRLPMEFVFYEFYKEFSLTLFF